MATSQGDAHTISRDANATLVAAQFRFLKLAGTGAELNTTAGGPSCGILQNKPVAGAAASIAVLGVTTVVAGAAFAVDADLASDVAGEAVTAVFTDHVLAKALEAATAANQVVEVLMIQASKNTAA